MTAPYRTGALSELTPEDLEAMLDEHETLFVEHKGNLSPTGDAYNVAKAVSAFANTLGGWVLIGVTNSAPNAGQDNGWDPVAPHDLVDRVRQVLERHVEPIPPFAATVIKVRNQPVGVIRVYESADTPHITRPDGAIYVRSVAADKKYHSHTLESQATLFALAERGKQAKAEAKSLLGPARTPLIETVFGLETIGTGSFYIRGSCVILRAVPLTHHRMAEWAVTGEAQEVLSTGVSRLIRESSGREPSLQPRASGLVVRQRTETELPLLEHLEPPRGWDAVAATDAAGVVGVGIIFATQSPPGPKTTLSLDNLQDGVFIPLLESGVDVLMAGEFLGGIHLELRVAGLDKVFDLTHEGAFLPIPSQFPTSAELSLPGAIVARDGEPTELVRIADQWTGDLAREAGSPVLR